jgi:hypothetical protein
MDSLGLLDSNLKLFFFTDIETSINETAILSLL